MDRLLTIKEYKRMAEELDKVKYKCRCGHIVIIPKKADKTTCSWCGYYVFKSKQAEFKYRLIERLGKIYDTRND